MAMVIRNPVAPLVAVLVSRAAGAVGSIETSSTRPVAALNRKKLACQRLGVSLFKLVNCAARSSSPSIAHFPRGRSIFRDWTSRKTCPCRTQICREPSTSEQTLVAIRMGSGALRIFER
jgi:hypothetical protein